MCFRKRGGLGKRQREKWGSVQHVAADTNTRRNKLIITWPSETERRGLRFLSCRCSFFFHNAKLNPPRAAKTGGGSDLLDLPLLLVLGYLSVTLAVCSIDRHSGSAARRQQKWSNRGNWWQGFSKFSRTKSWDLTESWTSSRASVTVATRSNFGPLERKYEK
jgi:hypothetical protein